MTKINKAKYDLALKALSTLGLTAQDFVDLNMADCLACWAEDDPTSELDPMTVECAMEIHLDTKYFHDVIARALTL